MNNYILSIHKQWVELIKNGTKLYEFRSFRYINIKTGNKIYICQTKSKHHLRKLKDEEINWYPFRCLKCDKDFAYKVNNSNCISVIIGQFIIKQVWINADQQPDIKGSYHYIPIENYKMSNELYYQYVKNKINKIEYIEKNSSLQNQVISKDLTDHLGNNAHVLAFEISQLKIYEQPKTLLEFGFNTAPQFYYKVKE